MLCDMDLHRLRFAEGVAARKSYYIEGHTSRRQGRLPVATALIRASVRRVHESAEVHIDALFGLWDEFALRRALSWQAEEMRLTMARYEVVVCDLHAMQMRAFDL